MNSYPAELIMQLAPVMFVAGLESAATSNQQRRPRSTSGWTSPPSSSSTPSGITSDAPIQLGSSSGSPRSGGLLGNKPDRDPFALLASRLRDALASQRRPAVWSPEAIRKGKIFQVMFVDKGMQFPPRKLPPPLPEAGQHPHHGPNRSPLSPLHPSSPLFPDGLIAPLWVRKHTALVPSVFVYFLRLYEHPPPPADHSDDEAQKVYKEGRERMEKDRDAELAREIALRKEGTNERSIKLTVVLLANRGVLDDPSLDSRLSYLRRRANLDARAALFVLSPVSQAELVEFVKSLQGALIDPALEYYTAHSKRVRRKRNRVQQNPSSLSGFAAGSQMPYLRPEGWTVRYEYKMACFAEFRGEDEVALKHFQDSYNALLGLFTSVSVVLPARTKRWAEAKVLADCINIKICKLYLYNAESSLALSQFNTHLRRFSELSTRTWGIGYSTYEYWAWIGRQYRVFAELLEQGTLSVPPLIIPTVTVLAAAATTDTNNNASSMSPPILQNPPSLGIGTINPCNHLMHPGFYYAAAASCAEKRRAHFLTIQIALEDDKEQMEPLGPGFENEKKTDHLGTILELYTKAYELFKKFGSDISGGPGSPILAAIQPQDAHRGGQNFATSLNPGSARFPLWVAYRIALTHYASGRCDTASRFFERIAKMYTLRREAWGPLLRPVLSTWYACSQRTGDIDLGVRLAIEMMLRGYPSLRIPGHIADGLDGEPMSMNSDEEDEGEEMVEDLMAVFRSTVPAKQDETLYVDIPDCDTMPLVCSPIFWEPVIEVDCPMPFQLMLAAPNAEDNIGIQRQSVLLDKLPINRVELFCETVQGEEDTQDKGAVISIEHAASTCPSIQIVDVGDLVCDGTNPTKVQGKACLRWANEDSMLVIRGNIRCQKPLFLKFTRGIISIAEGKWTVYIPFKFQTSHSPSNSRRSRWLASPFIPKFIPMRRGDTSIIMAEPKKHSLTVNFIHEGCAFLDERFPVSINITNMDTIELDILADVLLHPSEDDSTNFIEFGEVKSTGLIKGVSFGSLGPGKTEIRLLYLSPMGAAGERMLDVSVQSKLTSAKTGGMSRTEHSARPQEHLQSLVVPVVSPFTFTHEVTFSRRADKPEYNLGDLDTFNTDYWDDLYGGEAHARTTLTIADGHDNISIMGVEFIEGSNAHSKLMHCSVASEIFPQELWPGDDFLLISDLSLAPPENHFVDDTASLASPGSYQVSWRRTTSAEGSISHTRIELPQLHPPPDRLVALLKIPTMAHLHKPFVLEIVLRNLHQTRTACPSVILDLDASDAFIVAGLRSGQLPTLLPGAETRVSWQLIPLECGPNVDLPKIRILNRRKSPVMQLGSISEAASSDTDGEEEEVEIIDVRRDERWSDGSNATRKSRAGGAGVVEKPLSQSFKMFVSPSMSS